MSTVCSPLANPTSRLPIVVKPHSLAFHVVFGMRVAGISKQLVQLVQLPADHNGAIS